MTSSKGCVQWLPARFILAFLGFTGITLQYVMKVNLSVAIVAMVKTNSSVINSTDGQCPSETSNDISNLVEGGDFDWETSKQGLLLSSYYYGYVTTQFFSGYLSQRYGGRHFLGSGVAISGILTLFTALVARWSFVGLLILRALEGVASGFVIPSMQAMFSLWYPPQERQRFAGFIFSSINFGSLVGLSLAGLLADLGGWPLVFYVTGGLAVAWVIPWLLLVHDSPKTHPRISDEEKNYIVNGLGQDPSSQHKAPKSIPWLQIFLCPPIWAAILVHTGSSWVMYTLLNELPTYLSNVLHFNVRNSGVLSSLPHLFAWISANLCGAASQWIRSKHYLSHLTTYRIFNGIMCLGIAACFGIIILVKCDATTIMVMFILSMFFNGFIYGGSYLNHVDLASNHTGTLSGILHTILNTPGFITPVVTAAFLDGQHTIERWQKVFYVAIGIVCGVYIVYLIFGSVTERSWNSWGMEEDEEENNKKNKSQKEIPTVSTNLKQEHEVTNYGI